MSDLLLGIDVGTYSSKGVLVEADGTVLKTHVVEHNMDIPQQGWAEQDADDVWWADVVSICHGSTRWLIHIKEKMSQGWH